MSQKRIKKVQKALPGWGVDTLVLTDPIDLFYLSGMHLSLGTIVVKKDVATLIVDNRYFEKCQKEACLPVVPLELDALDKLLTKSKTVGFAQENLTYASFLKLQQATRATLVPLEFPMQEIRAIKEPAEVKALEKAIELCYQGFDFIKDHLRVGVTESTLAKDLEIFWLKNGGEKLSFDSIIAFGKSSSMPHYRASNTALKANEIVLVDIGIVVDGYASDMTRTFFFGKPDSRLEKIYDIVLDAQQKSIKAIKPGISCAKAYEVSKKVIDRAGFGERYLHGLGHGIGLETHEYPNLRAANKDILLQPGMCVTVEPGIYLPDIGGVRIEDMILITKDACRNLTADYPKTKTILPIRK
ncbi:MAG: Xaa-Pro peptidase family protein [Chlamydiales bacterium]|nr:Xaa-Pro peptidase family protein [Chlamydiales bacterium]